MLRVLATFFNIIPSTNIQWTYSTRSIEGCGMQSPILDMFGYRASIKVIQKEIMNTKLLLLGSYESFLRIDCE
jgi:hypothetical protein